MKQWHAKEFAKLAQVSVRTLHHYDRIDLLKPSLRQSNNYRLYSEADLLRLQQIIALKFFGFNLTEIKLLLTKHTNVSENFALQSRFLREKAESLLEASSILEHIAQDCDLNTSIPWEKVLELIEVYKMTQQLENAWVKEILTTEELKEYAAFETALIANTTPEQKEQFEKGWFDLVDEFKQHLHQDPNSPIGIALGKKLMDWVNHLYGKEHSGLRTKIFEQGFGEGKGLEEHGLTKAIVAWMDKAVNAYWKDRFYTVLAQAGKISSAQLLRDWNDLMDDLYGNQDDRKAAIPGIAMQDSKISPEAKVWLKTTFNL